MERKFKDQCTGEVVTLEEALEHVIATELVEDAGNNQVLLEAVPNLLKEVTIFNYREQLTEEDMLTIVKYYDYAEI